MAVKIRGNGCFIDEAHEGIGRQKSALEEDVPRGHKYADERLKAEIVQERSQKSGKAISAQRDGP
jgi:hypothetical protein